MMYPIHCTFHIESLDLHVSFHDDIRSHIYKNYEQMEGEKTKLLIATHRQKVIEKGQFLAYEMRFSAVQWSHCTDASITEAETDRKRAMIEAQKLSDVSRITSDMGLLDKKTHQTIQTIKGTCCDLLICLYACRSKCGYVLKIRSTDF